MWPDQEQQKSNPTEWARPLPPHDWLALSVVGRGKEEMWAVEWGGGEEREPSRSAQARASDQEGARESERECGSPDVLASASWVASLDACAVALGAPRAAGGCPVRLRSRRRRRQGEVEAVERQRQQRVPGLRQQRGRRQAEAEVTKAAAAAAVSLTVAETKAAAADGERPGPGPLLVGCGRAAVGPARLPPPAAPPPAPPPGRRRGPGPARTQSAAAAAAGAVGGGGGGAMGGLASGGDVEPGLPVEVRGSNGAFYKVRRCVGRGHPRAAPSPRRGGGSGAGPCCSSRVPALRALEPRSRPRPPGGALRVKPLPRAFGASWLHLLSAPSPASERTNIGALLCSDRRPPPPASSPRGETPFSQLLVDFSRSPRGRHTLDPNHVPPPRSKHMENSLYSSLLSPREGRPILDPFIFLGEASAPEASPHFRAASLLPTQGETVRIHL